MSNNWIIEKEFIFEYFDFGAESKYSNDIYEKMKNSIIKNERFDSSFFSNVLPENYKRIYKLLNNPFLNSDIKNILLYGKVQSGKTINSIILCSQLLENDIADFIIILGGTITNLKDQTLKRFEKYANYFRENFGAEILSEVDESFIYEYLFSSSIKSKKLIGVFLKHQNSLDSIYEALVRIPGYKNLKIVIIDDEADIASIDNNNEGSEKIIFNGIRKISSLDTKINLYFPVTATPFDNILINKNIDYIIPLLESEKYFGLKDFFKNTNNLVIEEDKKKAIQMSLKHFKKVVENSDTATGHQLLLNISSDTKEHDDWTLILKKEANDDIENLDVLFFNYKNNKNVKINKKNYNEIIVGGNLLGRGITYEGLVSEVIYNFSSSSDIDTLLQKARWFGYREKTYKDTKIFMSKDLYLKYLGILDFEESLFQIFGDGKEIGWNEIQQISFLKKRV